MPAEKPDYDFIFNPPQPGKKSILPLPGGSSTKSRAMVAGAGALLLLIVGFAFMSFLSNLNKADTEALVAAAQQQHELIRLAEVGTKKARSQAAKDIAITTKLALQSQQDDMLAAVRSAGRKLSRQELAAARNPLVDEALTKAEQNNRFDEEFMAIMNSALDDYQKAVKRAYEGAKDSKLRSALAAQFESANVLAGATAEPGQ